MNYDILFTKCKSHNIDLRWLIFGDEGVELEGSSGRKEKNDLFATEQVGERALECIKMIRSLPWSVSVRRKIMEYYITLVYEDL